MAKTILLSVSILIIRCSLLISQVTTSSYIKTGNDSIFYEISGSGPTIVLIHDGLIHREVWDAQFIYFSKKYKVVRYDRRGYGKSSPATGNYSNLEDLNTLFTQLKIDRACLIGASSGGRLAIDFTLMYPQKASSMILVGAVVGGFSFTKHFNTRGGHLPSDLKDNQKESLYYASDDPYEIYHENKAAKNKIIELVKNNPIRIYGSQIIASQKTPAYKRLNEINIPVLILCGEFDIPDVHAHAGAINAGISNSRRIVIPKAGHLIPMEQPDLFNETVASFLKQIDNN
jgi:pimeloyl-ACP methyl ester carboxylesterase